MLLANAARRAGDHGAAPGGAHPAGNRHHPPVADEEDDALDVEAAVYEPLDASRPGLAASLRNRFVRRFLHLAELSEGRHDEAAAAFRIDRGVAPQGELVLRLAFPFCGWTGWYEWDGTAEEATAYVDETAELRAHEVGHDQAHGPTGWETEFDDPG